MRSGSRNKLFGCDRHYLCDDRQHRCDDRHHRCDCMTWPVSPRPGRPVVLLGYRSTMHGAVSVARILDHPLSVDRLMAAVQDPGAGGIALFAGTVRDHDTHDADAAPDTTTNPESAARQRVVSLDYTQHPTASRRLTECADRAAAIDGVYWVAAEHRVGHLDVGDLAVVVAVSAAHRQEAFTGCRQLIEELKSGVPIWKEQTFADGIAEWVGLP
jgi:molybdopterin synthase catalytic subunit